MKQPKLLAVVVSYGGSARLPALLSALVGVDGCQVLLMENQVGMRHPSLPSGVRAYQGHGNVGYGTAVNLGVRLHLERDPAPDWLLVVNSDIALPAGMAERLAPLLAAAPAQTAVVGFPIRTSDRRPGRDSSVLPSARTNAFIALRGEAAAVARWPERRYPVGAFFAIRTEAFLRLDGFDPAYWMYYEETDLFCRYLGTGGRIWWPDETWQVVHDGGATTGTSRLMHRELGRSAAIYFRHHRGDLGPTWPAVHAAQLLVLAARKGLLGQPVEAARALRILHGLATGLARPDWEPACRTRWRAVSSTSRIRVGRPTNPIGHALTTPNSRSPSQTITGVERHMAERKPAGWPVSVPEPAPAAPRRPDLDAPIRPGRHPRV